MKKVLCTLLIGAAIYPTAQARDRVHGSTIAQTASPFASRSANKTTGTATDTLVGYGFEGPSSCATTVYYAGSTPDSGYISGTNSYGDLQKLMRFTLSDYELAMPASVSAVSAWFALKSVKNNGQVTAKIYADNGSGAPGTLLGTSVAQTVSALDTGSQAFAVFTFANPVNITTNNFFAAIDLSALYATQDTLALFSTEDCADAIATDAWEQENDGTYYQISNSWGLNLDLAIFPAVTGKTLGISAVSAQAFKAACYPVPASGSTHISFTSPVNGAVSVVLKDMTGKTVSSQQISGSKDQNYTQTLDVSNLSAGLYFCELSAGNNRQVIKVSIR